MKMEEIGAAGPVTPESANEKGVNAHTLVGDKLGKVAKRVRDQLTHKEEVELLSVDAMSVAAAMERLSQVPRPVKDRDIIGFIMALVKAKASEGDYARAFKSLKEYYAEYKDPWLKAAREYCAALLEAKEEGKAESVRYKNQVGKDSFWDLRDFALEVLKTASHTNPKLFRRGTDIARIAIVKEEDSAAIEALERDEFIAAFPGRFVESAGDGKTRPAEPPFNVLKNVFLTPNLPLPYLSGLTRFPTFGADGSMQNRPGYSPATLTFYAPPVGLEIPQVGEWKGDAREEDVAKAKRLLVEELLGDFPFDGWDRKRIMAAFNRDSGEKLPASLLNLLALLLTPFVRPMIAGPTPLTLISKPAAGTGATYAAEAIQLIVTGVPSARAPLSNAEEERRKVLFTAIMTGEPVVLFDNQKGTLDSATLASALTSMNFTDRVLGQSSERRLPINSSFVMTSNNIGLSEELQRRISLVRMDAKTPNPKDRGGWRHASLHSWIEVNRARLLWAILTLVQNWVTRACQGPKRCPAIASYTGWAYVLGGILEAADPTWTQFQGNRAEIGMFAAAGEEDGAEALIAAWHEKGGADMSANELAVLMESETIEIDDVRKTHDGGISPRSLGKHLASLNGRHFVVNGVELSLTRATRHNAAVWKLEAVKDEAEVDRPRRRGERPKSQQAPRVPSTYRNFPLFPDPVVKLAQAKAADAVRATGPGRGRGRGRGRGVAAARPAPTVAAAAGAALS